MSSAEFLYPEECFEIPTIDLRGGKSAFRCFKCQGYISRYCAFENGGQQVKCSLCQFVNKVPEDHFGVIDEFGKRADYETNL